MGIAGDLSTYTRMCVFTSLAIPKKYGGGQPQVVLCGKEVLHYGEYQLAYIQYGAIHADKTFK